ncbi:uncharacterized protein LOC105639038 [Jatropha curcas]|uniref:uncharacterized protein LOC105639038 n=1 Tax=Jatropha curcas TaxID=180498 RepID=UPI0018961682|nr:uncharacterized protein LOC105639038 [Jatropha curcas]
MFIRFYMGNIIKSFVSGFTTVITNFFSSPLDFLAGKSCSSVCGSTWDFICYIENFCVANLLKLAMVLALFHIVLLFFYLSYKLGIYECIFHSLCKMIWACLISCFSLWECCFIFLCNNFKMLISHRRRREFSTEFSTSEIQDYNYEAIRSTEMEVTSRSLSRRGRRDYRRIHHLRKYIRTRNHRIQVGLSAESEYGYGRNYSNIKHGNYSTNHKIRVVHSSRFVRKGTNLRPRLYSKVRW